MPCGIRLAKGDFRGAWPLFARHRAGRWYAGAMPLFLFEPDQKVSLRAFFALALAVIFCLAR
jgi:hypothetical protein